MRLSFTPVTADKQFRDLLRIRNECRAGMTNNQEEITDEQQSAFAQKCWEWGPDLDFPQISFKRETWYEPYLLSDYQVPIGFGLLYCDGERFWMTIGLVAYMRGKGLAKLLTGLITSMGNREGREIWLDVWEHNRKALASYISVGYRTFKEQETADGLRLTMKYDPR